MAKKHAPDCPCCGNGLVYSYDGGPVLSKDCVITCNTCHTEYKLSKLEVIALDDYMSKGLEAKAVNVLLHKDQLDQFFTTVPHLPVDPVVRQEEPKNLSSGESEDSLNDPFSWDNTTKRNAQWAFGAANPDSVCSLDGSLNPFYTPPGTNNDDHVL